jgi:hypothetical protein
MSDESMRTCSTCQCEFSLEAEGGINGYFGILPMSFCPTCLCCMEDMCDQLRMPLDEQLLELSEDCGKKDEKILIQASTILKRMNND